MTDPVVIVGAGPTGLALAAELGLAGVPCRVLEKRSDVPNITRAFGVNPRTLELLNSRGLADEVISRGVKVSEAVLGIGANVDLSKVPAPYNFLLVVPQSGTETALEKRCHDLGVEIERGAEVLGLRQDADGVDVTIPGEVIRASYVVGCDGAHSRVRDEIGMSFVGDRYDVNLMLADVRLANPPTEQLYTGMSPVGIQLFVPFGDGYYRSISFRHGASADQPLTLAEVADASQAITGEDFGFTEARWMSRFLSERRQAKHYRSGRVFLAGDAAHVHSPAGAQGMNTGIGDAMNLGWKLAAAMKGTAPAWLLDSYEAERHPVGEKVLKVTDRMFRLVMVKSPIGHKVVGTMMRQVFKHDVGQRFPRSFLSGMSVSYEPRGSRPHKLAGKRAPHVTDLAEHMRSGKFVLIASGRALDENQQNQVVEVVRENEPPFMLVRPDGYVAWAGDSAAQAKEAVTEWVYRTSSAAQPGSSGSSGRKNTL